MDLSRSPEHLVRVGNEKRRMLRQQAGEQAFKQIPNNNLEDASKEQIRYFSKAPDFETITNLQTRLFRVETEMSKIKSETPFTNSVNQMMAKLTSERNNHMAEVQSLRVAMQNMNERLAVSEKEAGDQGSSTEMKLGRLKTTTDRGALRIHHLGNVVDQDIKTVFLNNAQLSTEVAMLKNQLQLVKESQKEYEVANQYHVETAWGRMNRLTDSIAENEKRLADRMNQMQHQNKEMDEMERDNEFRKLRMVEERGEMVKDTTEKRLNNTATTLSRERKDRLQAEETFRIENFEKWNSIETSWQAFQDTVGSKMESFIRESGTIKTEQKKQISAVSNQVEHLISNTTSQNMKNKSLFEKAQLEGKAAAIAAVERVEKLLKAEIRVRTSAFASLEAGFADHISNVKNEMTIGWSEEKSKMNVVETKLAFLESDNKEQYSNLYQHFETTLQQQQRDHNYRTEELYNYIEQQSERISNLDTWIRNFKKQSDDEKQEMEARFENLFAGMEERIVRGLSGLKIDLTSCIAVSEKSAMDTVHEESKKANDALQRVENDTCIKLMNSRIAMESFKENLSENIHSVSNLLEDSLKNIENKMHGSRTQDNNLHQENLTRIATKHGKDLVQLEHGISLRIENCEVAHSNLASRFTQHQVTSLERHESIICETQAQLAAVETQTAGLEIKLTNCLQDIRAETKRATDREHDLEVSHTDRIVAIDTKFNTACRDIEGFTAKRMATSEDRMISMVENKLVVFRSVLKTNIQAECATRTEDIRAARKDLETLIESNHELQNGFVQERYSNVLELLKMYLKSEREYSDGQNGILESNVKKEITETASLLRDEQEIHSVLDTLLVTVEQQCTDDSQIRRDSFLKSSFNKVQHQLDTTNIALIETKQRIEIDAKAQENVLREELQNTKSEMELHIEVSSILDNMCLIVAQSVQKDIDDFHRKSMTEYIDHASEFQLNENMKRFAAIEKSQTSHENQCEEEFVDIRKKMESKLTALQLDRIQLEHELENKIETQVDRIDTRIETSSVLDFLVSKIVEDSDYKRMKDVQEQILSLQQGEMDSNLEIAKLRGKEEQLQKNFEAFRTKLNKDMSQNIVNIKSLTESDKQLQEDNTEYQIDSCFASILDKVVSESFFQAANSSASAIQTQMRYLQTSLEQNEGIVTEKIQRIQNELELYSEEMAAMNVNTHSSIDQLRSDTNKTKETMSSEIGVLKQTLTSQTELETQREDTVTEKVAELHLKHEDILKSMKDHQVSILEKLEDFSVTKLDESNHKADIENILHDMNKIQMELKGVTDPATKQDVVAMVTEKIELIQNELELYSEEMAAMNVNTHSSIDQLRSENNETKETLSSEIGVLKQALTSQVEFETQREDTVTDKVAELHLKHEAILKSMNDHQAFILEKMEDLLVTKLDESKHKADIENILHDMNKIQIEFEGVKDPATKQDVVAIVTEKIEQVQNELELYSEEMAALNVNVHSSIDQLRSDTNETKETMSSEINVLKQTLVELRETL